jgi:hypothetical protein
MPRVEKRGIAMRVRRGKEECRGGGWFEAEVGFVVLKELGWCIYAV